MRRPLLVLVTLALPACALHNDVPDSERLQAYWNDLGAAHCQAMVECCTAAEYNDWWTTSDGEVQDCKTAHQNPPLGFQIKDAVDRGTIVFDPARARACVAALQGLACTSFEQAFRYRETYCDPPLAGTLDNGAQCAVDEECLGNHCQDGACTDELPEGATCFIGVDKCVAPLRCNDTGGGNFTCNLGKPAGATCAEDDQCIDGWCKDTGSVDTCLNACDGQ